jgi:hypothetical protein
MMLGRADRSVMEWGYDGAAIVVVGADVEDQHETEHRERHVIEGQS